MFTVAPHAPVSRVDAATLASALGALHARTTTVVGWGSGSVFDYFQRLHPVRLDYLVDSDATRWGSSRLGVTIHAPQRLLAEVEATTLVVIYSSAWPAIQQQLARLGHFLAVPASALFADAATHARLEHLDSLGAQTPTRRVPTSRDAVVVQGPVVPGMTERVLRALSALHTRNRIVLSTWAGTDGSLLDAVRGYVDDLVLSDAPATAGIQNRNYQLVSTRAGVARAMAAGATTILKTRTDLAVLAPAVFDQARWWLARAGSDASRATGLSGRLIVPASYTRKYLLYHPSDMVMLGAAEDMARFWSAPLDPRDGDLLTPEWLQQPLASVNLAGNPAESYLGLAFCRSLGRPVVGTLRDSWSFYRDLFAVVDNDWFDLLWLKNLSIPDAALRSGVRQTIGQQFWTRLQMHDAALEAELDAVDPASLSLGALAGAA